jgi:hypothetical protein
MSYHSDVVLYLFIRPTAFLFEQFKEIHFVDCLKLKKVDTFGSNNQKVVVSLQPESRRDAGKIHVTKPANRTKPLSLSRQTKATLDCPAVMERG